MADIKKIFGAMTKTDSMSAPKNDSAITTQDTVPIFAVHEKENIIETYPGFFTKMYSIKDNNYQTETEESQEAMFVKLRGVFNSLGNNCELAITIYNKDINIIDFRDRVLKKETGDNLDSLRRELNDILYDRMKEGRNGIEKKKFLTLGIHTTDIKKAIQAFRRLDRDLDNNFKKLQSGCEIVPIAERLEVIHDIYNPDSKGEFLTRERIFTNGVGVDKTSFDFDNMRAQGISINDLVAPSSFQIHPKYLQMGKKYYRVMSIDRLPNALVDDFFVKLTDVGFNILATVNVRPIQSKEANAMVHKNIVMAQTEKSDQMKSLISAGLPEEMVSPDIQEKVDKALELRSSMINDDEKLFKTTYTLVFWADSLEKLQEYTDSIHAQCQGAMVSAKILTDSQEDGFYTTLPLLCVKTPYHKRRTLKSSSVTCVAMPFSNLELSDFDGINYSQNLYTKNLILYNRLLTQNYNGFILGSPGAGKSFSAKTEMLNVMLGSNSDLIIIDPESEYGALAKLIGGEVVKIEPGGKWHINPLEIDVAYEWTNEDDTEETNPILAKADFLLKLMSVMVKSPFGISSIQETIIDECVHELYKPFIDSNGRLQKIPPDRMPTLTDLQVVISGRKEPEARELAMALKLYTGDGSLNTFGYRGNVDVHNRFLVYDIKDIGDKLKPMAMLIILDSILNRFFENRRLGKNTWFWVDEIYLLFQDINSAQFLNMLWKRARKYGGVPTGITQNVEDLLESDVARKMLSNCNFVEILNQAPKDRAALADLLNLSESQVDVITSAPRGQGLIYTGSNCVPFASTFPKRKKDGSVNPIYKALTSNMKEIKQFEEEDKRRNALNQAVGNS